MQRFWVLFLLAACTLPAMAGDLAKGVSQRVIRFNAVHGPDVRVQTLEDCFEGEACLNHVAHVLNRTGGNPGLLKKGENAVAKVEGLRHHFEFVPAAAEHFCAAEFLRPSMAPTFPSRAPELWLEISAGAARIDIQLPQNAARSWVDGFLVLYGAAPGAERKCTIGAQTARYTCKGRCEAKSF
jgi:hypothetical protein